MARGWIGGPTPEELAAERQRQAAEAEAAREQRIQEKMATLRAATEREAARIAAESAKKS